MEIKQNPDCCLLSVFVFSFSLAQSLLSSSLEKIRDFREANDSLGLRTHADHFFDNGDRPHEKQKFQVQQHPFSPCAEISSSPNNCVMHQHLFHADLTSTDTECGHPKC